MVLVTGAHGFLGSFVVQKLRDLNIPVKTANHKEGYDSPPHYQSDYFNLGDSRTIEKLGHDHTGLIHLASTLSSDFDSVIKNDVMGMHALINLWQKGPFIFSSSMDVYPEREDKELTEESTLGPNTHYALGKVFCETELRMKAGKKDYIILRIPHILGIHPHFYTNLLGKMISTAIEGTDFFLRDTCSGTSWVNAVDLAECIVQIVTNPIPGIYNIASGWFYWHEVIEFIIKYLSSRSKIRFTSDKENPCIRKGRYLDCSKFRKLYNIKLEKSFTNEVIPVINKMEGSVL